jgi:rhamnosyltransferase
MGEMCSIIVSYKPPETLRSSIRELHDQGSDVIVVDNGSPPAAIQWLRHERDILGFVLLENGENLGIATALNRGVQRATAKGYQWIALFDQDSRVTEGYIAAMLQAGRSPDQGRDIAIYCPRYIDTESGKEKPIFNRDERGEPLMSMTSGSVMRAQLFERIGLFAEELFIYCVDDEFCLRARRHGFRLMLVSEARLLHREGAAHFVKILGRSFYVTRQPAAKRYYITRNQLWMYRRYPQLYPARGSSATNLLRLLKNVVRTLAIESQRAAKAEAMMRGAADCLRARMGRTVEL